MRGGEVFGRIAAFVAHLVSVKLVRGVGHPHGRAIGPKASRIGVAGGLQSAEVFGRISALVAHFIGINLVVFPIGHPHGYAIRPEAGWPAVSSGDQSVKVFGWIALLSGQVVGVKFVVSSGVVVGFDHPQCLSVRPKARRAVVAEVVAAGIIQGVQVLRRIAGGKGSRGGRRDQGLHG